MPGSLFGWVPDWLIKLMVRFNSPIRQIINDIGNEKHYDGTKGEALLGHPFRSPEEATSVPLKVSSVSASSKSPRRPYLEKQGPHCMRQRGPEF